MNDKAATGKASITAPSTSGNVIAKYLPVYFALLAIAGLEIFLAYRNFSVLTLLTTQMTSLNGLLGIRFLAGIGLGGIMPNAVALVGDGSLGSA